MHITWLVASHHSLIQSTLFLIFRTLIVLKLIFITIINIISISYQRVE